MKQHNDVDLSSTPFGCYRVFDRKKYLKISDHVNKVEALLTATKFRKNGIDADVCFLFYHDLFKNFNYSLCGKVPLTDLYRDRAQQLRDKYDYLILKYSGGSDSHNILHTFLKNKIKLDCIYVNWPVSANGKGYYKPNFYDRSSKNELSEWDFALKPDLDWLSQEHPEIEIHVSDWLADITREGSIEDAQFEKQNHYHSPISFYRMQVFSQHERNLADKGISAGIIEGADKPCLWFKDDPNIVNMGFIDWPLQHNLTFTGKGSEYFYWTPDMPLLAIEMAYQNFLYYKNNPRDRWLLDSSIKDLDQLTLILEQRFQIAKKVLYPYWDFSRFQAIKDLRYLNGIHNGKPQDWVFWKNHETEKIREKWNYYIYSYLNGIDPYFLNLGPDGKPIGYKPVYSLGYKIGSYS